MRSFMKTICNSSAQHQSASDWHGAEKKQNVIGIKRIYVKCIDKRVHLLYMYVYTVDVHVAIKKYR